MTQLIHFVCIVKDAAEWLHTQLGGHSGSTEIWLLGHKDCITEYRASPELMPGVVDEDNLSHQRIKIS